MKLKKRKLLTILGIVSVFLFAGCQKDDYKEIVGLCPTITTSNPLAGATNVPLNNSITVKFNERMDPSTINASSFTLLQTLTPVAGTLTYTDTTATFNPSSNLLANTSYTGRLTTAVKSLKGNALQSDFVWSFRTGTSVSPTVVSTDPTSNLTGVEPNKVISATFSVPMDPTTLNAATFKITQGTTPVAGTITYAGSTVFFTPTVNLLSNATYSVMITTGAMNETGMRMESNYIWNFVLKVI